MPGAGAQDEGAAGIAQGAPAGLLRVVFVGLGQAGLLFLHAAGFGVECGELFGKVRSNQIEQGFAGTVDDERIDVLVAGPEFGFVGNGEQGGLEGGADVGTQNVVDGLQQRTVLGQGAT